MEFIDWLFGITSSLTVIGIVGVLRSQKNSIATMSELKLGVTNDVHKVGNAITKLDAEFNAFSKHQETRDKRTDEQQQAAWRRIDELNKRVDSVDHRIQMSEQSAAMLAVINKHIPQEHG